MVFLLFLLILWLVLSRSILLLIRRTSWIMIWFSLELNTLSFLLLLTIFREYVNQGVKYFLIQTITTLLLVNRILLSITRILPIIIIMKIGLLPFHMWILDLLKEIDLIIIFTLFTFQKLPLFYILMFSYHFASWYYLLTILLLLIWTLSLMTREIRILIILLFSSIRHRYWMLLILQSLLVFITYFIAYSFFLLIVVYRLQIGYTPLYTTTGNNFLIVSLWGFRGFPPFTLFIFKWWVILILREHIILSFSLLLLIVWSVRIYYRVIWVLWTNKYLLIENIQIKHPLRPLLVILTLIPINLFFL